MKSFIVKVKQHQANQTLEKLMTPKMHFSYKLMQLVAAEMEGETQSRGRVKDLLNDGVFVCVTAGLVCEHF